jgi:outer membrane protein
MKLRHLVSFSLLVVAARAAAPETVPIETKAALSPWSVTVRATYLVTTDGSKAGGPLGLAADAIVIEDKTIPEFDLNYRINDQWALELVTTIPQEHTVKLKGVGELGNFKHLPPTLMVKYYAGEVAGFRPYVGAGVNFTLIFDENLGGLKLDSYSVGPAAQVGVDYALNERWALNFDVKRAMLRTDVELGGAKITSLELDPWLLAVGVNYAF